MSAKALCKGVGVRLAVGIGAGFSLMFFGSAGVAVGAPGTLTDGKYLVSFGDGQTETWTITSSCGIGCAVVDSSLGWSEHADIVPGGYWAPGLRSVQMVRGLPGGRVTSSTRQH